MINLAFIGPNREIIRFEIDNRKVTYFDKIWNNGIQIYPLNNDLIERMKLGGRTIKVMAALILDANQGKDLEEYNSCKTDEDIADFIRKDTKTKGMIEAK